jgi:hypothetical protein
MTAPNIVNLLVVFCRTSVFKLTDSTLVALTNPAGSSKVFKINSVILTNTNGLRSSKLTVIHTGITDKTIRKKFEVRKNSSVDLVNNRIYLQENESLKFTDDTGYGSGDYGDYDYGESISGIDIRITYEEIF